MNFLPENYMLNKKYKIVEKLAESDFSNVYIGKDGRKKIVIKECFPSKIVLRDVSYEVFTKKYNKRFLLVKKSFKNEIKIIKQLKHGNIVKLFDSFTQNNTVYLILEYCKGTSLKQYILENNLKETEILVIFKKILNIIEKIHNSGYIHRDIKPSNIIIHKDVIKLIDFGSAIQIKEKNGLFIKVTESYSPLEMYSLQTKNDQRTDIYSLFALLYFMFNKLKPMDVMKRFYYPELLFEDHISENLRKIIEKGMSLNIENRYEDIKEIKKIIFG